MSTVHVIECIVTFELRITCFWSFENVMKWRCLNMFIDNIYFREVNCFLRSYHTYRIIVYEFLTTVWTIAGLCSLRALTVWKTSTTPSAFSLSRRTLTAINVPVRPVPPLQWTTTGLSPELLCHFWTCPMRSMSPEPLSGTPSSGQPVYWNCFTGRLELSCNVIRMTV